MDIKNIWNKIKNNEVVRDIAKGVTLLVLVFAIAMSIGAGFVCIHADAAPLGVAVWVMWAFGIKNAVNLFRRLLTGGEKKENETNTEE